MIVVDTSALMAIVLNEPQAEKCMACLEVAGRLLVSAGTLAETLIVAAHRGVVEEITLLVEGLGFEILPVTEAQARRCALAYDTWGKGRHSAGLNFGDMFAYTAAIAEGCALLFVGEDFSKTDVAVALGPDPS